MENIKEKSDEIKTLNDDIILLKELENSEINCVLLKDCTALIEIMNKMGISYKDRVRIHAGYNNEICAVVNIYPLHYTDGQSVNGTEFVRPRFESIKEIYYRWCKVKGINPNHNEGWFKSKKFTRYVDSLNYHEMNYAIILALD